MSRAWSAAFVCGVSAPAATGSRLPSTSRVPVEMRWAAAFRAVGSAGT